MVVDKQGNRHFAEAQGVTKSQVRSIFIYQGLLVGLVGTLIGAVLERINHLKPWGNFKCGQSNGCFLASIY